MSGCAVPNCYYRDKHANACEDRKCKGCLPRQAEPGRQICIKHIGSVAPSLHTIAAHWGKLQARKLATNKDTAEVKTPAGPKSPVDVAVIDAIKLGDNVISYLTHIALDDFNGRPPSTLDSGRLADWLARMHTADITAIGDAALIAAIVDDLQEAATQIKHQSDPANRRTIELPVKCQTRDDDGHACGGKLTAVIYAADELLPSAIRCDRDADHELPPSAWRTLRGAVTCTT